jgi:hypothetical protein
VKNLFDGTSVVELTERLDRLTPASERQWGKMNAAQALAHCSASVEMAIGECNPPRMFVGRLFGGLVKNAAIGDDKPMKRNAPTSPVLRVKDDVDLDAERARLRELLERFAAGGAGGCTRHPHTFFGPLTPDEWAVLTYKHVDHHLRQFGV